ETYDPAWKAYVNGAIVPTATDPLHFLLIDAGPGEHDVVVRFETPLENRVGQGIFFVALAAVAWMLWHGLAKGRACCRGRGRAGLGECVHLPRLVYASHGLDELAAWLSGGSGAIRDLAAAGVVAVLGWRHADGVCLGTAGARVGELVAHVAAVGIS